MDIDFLLLQRMKRGDENAFNVFVRKYYKEILNYFIMFPLYTVARKY